MPQGPRRGWVRAVFTGLGVVLCTGLVGCMNSDKDRVIPSKIGNTKPAPPGLPGLNRIPGPPGSGGVGVNGQPTNGGFQPTGGFGSVTGRQPNSNIGVSGAGLGAGPGIVPSMNPGFQPTSGSGFSSMPQPNLGGASATGGYPTGGSAYPNNPPAVGNLDLGPIPPGPPGATSGLDPISAPVAPSPMIYKGGN
jgi:hypothetical protein